MDQKIVCTTNEHEMSQQSQSNVEGQAPQQLQPSVEYYAPQKAQQGSTDSSNSPSVQTQPMNMNPRASTQQPMQAPTNSMYGAPAFLQAPSTAYSQPQFSQPQYGQPGVNPQYQQYQQYQQVPQYMGQPAASAPVAQKSKVCGVSKKIVIIVLILLMAIIIVALAVGLGVGVGLKNIQRWDAKLFDYFFTFADLCRSDSSSQDQDQDSSEPTASENTGTTAIFTIATPTSTPTSTSTDATSTSGSSSAPTPIIAGSSISCINFIDDLAWWESEDEQFYKISCGHWISLSQNGVILNTTNELSFASYIDTCDKTESCTVAEYWSGEGGDCYSYFGVSLDIHLERLEEETFDSWSVAIVQSEWVEYFPDID